MPVKDEETGLLCYDMMNELYFGLHPPKYFGMKR